MSSQILDTECALASGFSGTYTALWEPMLLLGRGIAQWTILRRLFAGFWNCRVLLLAGSEGSTLRVLRRLRV